MKINITRLESLLEHYRSFYHYVVCWALAAVVIYWFQNPDDLDIKLDALIFLGFIWFNYRKVRKIEAECVKYELMVNDVQAKPMEM
jgi:hypothetical protein